MPSRQELESLNRIIESPRTVAVRASPEIRFSCLRAMAQQQLGEKDKFLVWKFRYWLRNNSKAVDKFVQAVNFHDDDEVSLVIPCYQQ